jgi:hypothetical protein
MVHGIYDAHQAAERQERDYLECSDLSPLSFSNRYELITGRRPYTPTSMKSKAMTSHRTPRPGPRHLLENGTPLV